MHCRIYLGKIRYSFGISIQLHQNDLLKLIILFNGTWFNRTIKETPVLFAIVLRHYTLRLFMRTTKIWFLGETFLGENFYIYEMISFKNILKQGD